MTCATKQPATGVGKDRIHRHQLIRQRIIAERRERDRNPSTIHRLRRRIPEWRVKAMHAIGMSIMVVGALMPASILERLRVRGILLLNARV